MSNLSNIVFAVTPKGFAALRNENTLISIELKTVLTMIDGICPVAQYEPFMRVFAPLSEKFDILEKQGYVRRTGTVSDFAVKIFQESAQSGMPLSKMPRIDSDHQESGFAPFS